MNWKETLEWIEEFMGDDEEDDWSEDEMESLAEELEEIYEAAEEIRDSGDSDLIPYANEAISIIDRIETAAHQGEQSRVASLLERLRELVEYVSEHED